MNRTNPTIPIPVAIAETAEKIYDERRRERLEATHLGHFVVINIRDGEAYTGQYAEEALGEARAHAPHGVFHLMRIGAPGAFRMRHVGQQTTTWNWLLRSAG